MRLPRFYQFFFSRFHSFHYALSARACLVVFLTAQGNPINYKLTMYDRHRRKVDYGKKNFAWNFNFGTFLIIWYIHWFLFASKLVNRMYSAKRRLLNIIEQKTMNEKHEAHLIVLCRWIRWNSFRFCSLFKRSNVSFHSLSHSLDEH